LQAKQGHEFGLYTHAGFLFLDIKHQAGNHGVQCPSPTSPVAQARQLYTSAIQHGCCLCLVCALSNSVFYWRLAVYCRSLTCETRNVLHVGLCVAFGFVQVLCIVPERLALQMFLLKAFLANLSMWPTFPFMHQIYCSGLFCGQVLIVAPVHLSSHAFVSSVQCGLNTVKELGRMMTRAFD
jgi:hypothetical protein